MLSILNSKAAVLMKRLLLVKSMGKSNLFISAAAWLYNELTYTMPLDILYKFVYKKIAPFHICICKSNPSIDFPRAPG